MKFTITGYMGSGKSTICNILSRQYDFRIISAGYIFRKIGIDSEIRKEAENVKEDENVIFDARLAWHFLEDTFNVFIVVSPYQAALRTYLTRKNEDEKYENLEDTINGLIERRVLENKRYKNIYGINCEDLNNYDLVIDTSHISALEACEIIMECYKKKTMNQSYEKLWISPEFVFPTLSIDCIDRERVDKYLDKIYNNEELDQVTLMRIHDGLFIEDGHNRVIAYNLAKIRLFHPLIVLDEDDVNENGVVVKKSLSVTKKDLKDWEDMNGFTYHYCPRIIEKRSQDANR